MMEKKISTIYSNGSKFLLYSLLLFSPLARGSVHYWQHTVIFLFALALLSLLLLEKGLTGKPCLYKTAVDKPIGALLLLCLVSLFFSVSKPDSVEAFFLLLSYLMLFYGTIYCIRTREDQRELVYVICGIGAALVVIASFKALGMTPSFWTYTELNYPKEFLSGVYGNHNHLAGYLEMAIPLLVALFLTRTRRGMVWAGLFCGSIMLVGCQILTMSRGGWFSLGTAMTFMTLALVLHQRFRSKKLLLLLFASSLVIVFCVLSGSSLFDRALSLADEETVLGMNGRVLAWKGTVALITEYPLLGAGPGTFATIFPQFQPPGTTARFYQAHNDYLQYLAEQGLLFLPLLGWMTFTLFHTARSKLHSTSRQTWGITLGAMTGIVAILSHSFVDFNLHIPANAILFTVLAAIVFGGPRAVVKK